MVSDPTETVGWKSAASSTINSRTMVNNVAKAECWRDFILAQCHYPAIDRLRAQFANATLQDFCQCGCNSFAVVHNGDALPPPIAATGRGGMVFEADFWLPDEKPLEILLFADEAGLLSYVEIDCAGNSFPVPDNVELGGEPFGTYTSDQVLT